MLRDLVERNRSYRRFDNSYKITESELKEIIDYARICPSGRNAQPLKYRIAFNKSECSKVFPLLSWAGYLEDWLGPSINERPSAYIVVVKDLRVSKVHYCDDGIAIQTLLLAAVEKGLGGCIMGAFHKKKLAKAIDLSNQFEPLYVIALGKPSEKVLLDEVKNNDTRYYRDENDDHHVPKRSLSEILI